MSTAPVIMCNYTHTGMDDLVDVLEVAEYVPDWKKLGLTLGLRSNPTLSDIEISRRYIAGDCRLDMLIAWLQRRDNVSQRGLPSWNMLKVALLRIGHKDIADMIVSAC